ncbi:orc1/cdc6 family replication initiation protein (plasmid) [Halobacterium sp. GSL-19]|uniref:Cdc6/Cdc18 family protein n=1 Tax=Halobacterium sp. GSL-19 TaxID=2812551 RepID=UPI001963A9E7|nr:Cdc6/Cdc18 family protein [Halobacterium sp. GSL-19]QRY21777.1 orc1/cdc6 family replication initiation protein [Halobacterium sp. GSL-19]
MLTDPSVFDEGWVPGDLDDTRDAETTALSSALMPLANGTSPQPVLIAGPPGTGKTATSRFVLDDLRTHTPTATAYIDTWTHHRPYQTFGRLLDELGSPRLVQPQTPLTVLRQDVRDARPGQGVVVVLDEADQLDTLDIVEHLDAMMGVALVLVVNDRARYETRLRDAGIELGATIPYEPYSVQELVGILKSRAHAGLDPRVCRDDRLWELSREAGGNAREAIQGLRAAADHARHEGHTVITPSDVSAGLSAARDRIRRKTRSRLHRHERVVLDIVEDLGDASRTDIYAAYRERVGEQEANGERRVGDYLSKLESYNQIKAVGESRARTYQPVEVWDSPS